MTNVCVKRLNATSRNEMKLKKAKKKGNLLCAQIMHTFVDSSFLFYMQVVCVLRE